MSLDLKKQVLLPAVELIKQAGQELQKIYEKGSIIDFSIKSKGQIVTKADQAAEDIILSGIKKQWPDHAILSEESGANGQKSDYTWVVDPLDGTTNYTIKTPFWNTTLALIHKNEPVLGIVYAPMFDELYWTIKNEGAYLNANRITTNKGAELDKAFHVFCFGSDDPKDKIGAADYYKACLREGYPIRQLGAAALELARVAAGVLDSMIVPGANAWDVMAGALLIREAGGVATDLNGQPYTLKSTSGIIAASNKEMHGKVSRFFTKSITNN